MWSPICERIVPAADMLWHPFRQAAATGPQSEDVRERLSLLRAFFSFVHSLVHSELTSVLSAPQNSAHMGPSLQASSPANRMLTAC